MAAGHEKALVLIGKSMLHPKFVGSVVLLAAAISSQSHAVSLDDRISNLEKVQLTGGFRLNYTYKDWDKDQTERGGDFTFNQINLGIEAEHGDVRLSSQYRWYDNGSGGMIHHLYFATDLGQESEVQLGLMKVPFGILPYQSHSYWADNSCYLGFNDDYDTGVKIISQQGNWNLQAAYFASGDAGSSDTQRFSFDVVTDSGDQGQQNTETHQLNLRAAYKLAHSQGAYSNLGASVQYGGLYNNTTEKMGNVWAAALHMDAQYGPVGVQSQVMRYNYNPENPQGVSDDTVQLGAFGVTYEAASEANIYVMNLSYDLPFKGGIVDQVQLYNDYNLVDKDEKTFKNSEINTLGVLVVTGNLYTNFDLTTAKNSVFIGDGDYKTAYAKGDGNNDWDTFFNIQFGYYF